MARKRGSKPGDPPGKKNKKKYIPSTPTDRKERCTYGWERRKILGRRGIRIDDFSSRWWRSFARRSRSNEVMLSRARDPVQHWISPGTRRLILYLDQLRGCAIQPPRSASQPSLFAFSSTPRLPSMRSVWWFDGSFPRILLLLSTLCKGTILVYLR